MIAYVPHKVYGSGDYEEEDVIFNAEAALREGALRLQRALSIPEN